jgi:Spy/CpxP family protein refolding chaperone
MKHYVALALLILLMFLFSPVAARAAEEKKPAPRDDSSQGVEEAGRDFRAWLERWWKYLGGTTAQEQQPVISLMLRNREKLGLSDDQVKKLEQLRVDFEKVSIRNDAESRVAEIDLTNLLRAQNRDLAGVEAKIREIERLRGDLRIERIRAVEKGKALLTPDQRKKLNDLLIDQPFSPFQSWKGR